MKKSYLILSILFSLLLLNVPSVYAQLTAEQYLHLGNLSSKQEDFKNAILDYTKAIEAVPDYANAYYNRGYAYTELKKYKLAIADLDKAIEINPSYAPAYHVRGIVYFFKKKYTQAIADYSKAIELDPDNMKFYISRMSADFKVGDSDKTWEDVIKIQKLGGTVDPTILNILKNKKYRDQESP